MSERGTPDKGAGRLNILTPEGVELRFELADPGARAAAFLLDALLMLIIVVVLNLLGALASAGGDGWSSAVFFLFFFLVRQFYFAFFELRWHGQTPGKRSQGLRVVEARGGALRPESILARNLTRDLEVFLPLTLLLAPEAIFSGVTGGARFAAAVWALLFAFLPTLNGQRMRVGDFVAGTRVVRAPKAVLLDDLGAAQPSRASAGPSTDVAAGPADASATASFTAEQLGHYGIFELQTLEDLLRTPEAHASETFDEVARKIRRRIGAVTVTGESSLAFLRRFYAAQRAHLEQRAVMGERIEDKGAARGRRRRG
jgi:uncharacterized RDD family membrane protein YckC